MFENHRKSRILHCDRSELSLHFLFTKNPPNWLNVPAKSPLFGQFYSPVFSWLALIFLEVGNFHRDRIGYGKTSLDTVFAMVMVSKSQWRKFVKQWYLQREPKPLHLQWNPHLALKFDFFFICYTQQQFLWEIQWLCLHTHSVWKSQKKSRSKFKLAVKHSYQTVSIEQKLVENAKN